MSLAALLYAGPPLALCLLQFVYEHQTNSTYTIAWVMHFIDSIQGKRNCYWKELTQHTEV